MAIKHRAISALSLALLALAGVRSAAALSAPAGLEGVWEADREALEALALYPEDVRSSILEASTRPGVLVRIESIRAWTNRDFRALLSSQPQEEQDARVPFHGAQCVQSPRSPNISLTVAAA